METTKTATANNDTETTIDLLEVGRVLWMKKWIIVIALLIGAILAFGYTQFMVTPLYKSTATIYIFSKTTSITSLTDLQLGDKLAEDFKIIATTRSTLEGVIDELGLDMTYEQLYNSTSVVNPSNSHMLSITVTNSDPALAAKISNALSDKMRDQIADIMNTDRPSTVQRAVVPTSQSSPSMKKNVALGGILLAIVAAVIIVIRYLMDDTIKNGDDVKKYLALDTLAEFPLLKGEEKESKSASKKPQQKKTAAAASKGR